MDFSWRDWSASIIPSCLFALGGLKDLFYHTAICNYLLVVLWVSLYIYSFNLFTQSLSLEEDRVNKPDRPLPSGKTSADAAMKRCIIAWAASFAITLLRPQIIAEVTVWVLVTSFLGATKAGGHWIGKNVFGMSIGCWALLSPSRKLMGPQTTQTSRHIIAMSLWAAFITHSQDFRDQEGDRKSRRKTLPIAFGDQNARYILAFVLTPLAFFSTCLFNLAQTAPWLLGAMHALVAYRFLTFRNAESDHKTYMVSMEQNRRYFVYGR
jgi:4-hydroxybenzoate polyprenyltransferase